MGSDSNIEWTHHTFNPWRGCTKVSPGCANCYAETMSHRNPSVLGVWGDGGTRVIAAESYWRQPLKWDKAAMEAGEQHRVFCASLADVFEDRPSLDEPRQRLFDLILQTPHLDWLLLTKRPEVMRDYLLGGAFSIRNVHEWGRGWPNVQLGVSVENQEQRKRIKTLLDVPASVHWLSMEPLLEEVDIEDYLYVYHGRPAKRWPHGHVGWVIVGGESGPYARPFREVWARSLVQQCRRPGVPVFVKQLGSHVLCDLRSTDDGWPEGTLSEPTGKYPFARVHLKDKKGGNPDEWPEDLRVREFPKVAAHA